MKQNSACVPVVTGMSVGATKAFTKSSTRSSSGAALSGRLIGSTKFTGGMTMKNFTLRTPGK